MTGFEKPPLCESSGLGASIEKISSIPSYSQLCTSGYTWRCVSRSPAWNNLDSNQVAGKNLLR